MIDPALQPTPIESVGRMSHKQRCERVTTLVTQSHELIDEAIATRLRDRDLAASVILWSGGRDSNTLAHIVRDRVTHALHANTGIGIERTRTHVRDACVAWRLPLIEEHPPVSYRDLVLERGFPGPAQHWKMYTRLKERCLDQARYRLGVARSRKRAALYIAGRRRSESDRRRAVPFHESDGSVIWVSPIALWTSLDLATYRIMHPDVPRNPVAEMLHMSGECLCGAFAKTGELDMIGEWYPDVVAEIRQLEKDASEAGIPYPLNLWGWGADPEMKELGTVAARALGERLRSGSGRLCSSCTPPKDLRRTA